MNAWQARRSLTAEQKEILSSKAVDFRGSCEDVIKTLTPVAAYDAAMDGMRAPLVWVIVLSILALIPTLILGAKGGWSPQSAAPFFLCLALGGTAIALRLAVGKTDLSNNLRDSALPVFRFLAEDFARGEAVHVQMDLRPPTDPAKKQGVRDLPKRGRYYQLAETAFEDPWLTVEGTMNDGAHLTFRVIESLRVIDRRKRGASGKTRMSTIHRKKTRVAVQLAVRRSDYDVTSPEGGRVKSGPKRHVISLSRAEKTRDLSPISPTLLLDVVTDAYRSVHRIGKEATAQ